VDNEQLTEKPAGAKPARRGDFGSRTRWTAFAVIAGAATLVAVLLKLLARFDWGVFAFGWTGAVGLALFLALYLGKPSAARRWVALAVVGLVGVDAFLWLIIGAKLPAAKVALFGLLPFFLIVVGAVGFVRRRVSPHRVVQIVSFAALNGFILAYVQGTIIYQGIFKSTLQPILNCYGGPMAVFACPLGSMQQIIGIHQFPWMALGAFIVVGAFFGRAACGWLCPFGMWQDLLYKVKAGPKAGAKRWAAFGGVAVVAGIAAVLLILLVPLPWWQVLVYGWLPLTLLALVVTLRGKADIPQKLWVGGLAAALGLGALVWFRYSPPFGVVTAVGAMLVVALTGRWVGAAIAAAAAFLFGWLGGSTPLLGLSGIGLGLAAAGAALVLVVVLDVVLRARLPANWLKFSFLVVVAGVAAWFTAEPWFCKLCPQGTFGAGIPLVLWDPVNALRGLVGWLYWVKVAILLLAVVAAMGIKRPFCRLVCPIGAIYSLHNKASLLKLKFDRPVCKDCKKCARVCPMNIDPTENQSDLECIRCFECAWTCPTSALKPGI
jgi:Pyruvate/2-oxoacid:ferredoxin oxidoreductase delta subunit